MDLEKITHTCVRVQGALCSDAWREIKLFSEQAHFTCKFVYFPHYLQMVWKVDICQIDDICLISSKVIFKHGIFIKFEIIHFLINFFMNFKI